MPIISEDTDRFLIKWRVFFIICASITMLCAVEYDSHLWVKFSKLCWLDNNNLDFVFVFAWRNLQFLHQGLIQCVSGALLAVS
jgi:intracellular septation protein A